MAISAFSQDVLDRSGVTTIQGLQASVPSLQFGTLSAFGVRAIASLRGIGADSLTPGADPGVAIHKDGVYLGRATASLRSFYDIETVEVLRGPQGTFYGRNATGGAININTKQPSFKTEVFGDALIGDYEHLRLRGVVGGALGEKVAGRLTMSWEEHDGYIENVQPGSEDIDDLDDYAIRGQLLFELGENFQARLIGTIQETGGSGPASRFLFDFPPAYAAGLRVAPPFPGAPFVATLPAFGPGYLGAIPNPDDLHKIASDFEGGFDSTENSVNFILTWEAENFTLKSTSSWLTDESDILRDGDISNLPLWTKSRYSDAEQVSQEFVLTSNGDGKLEWVVGAFYYHEEVFEDAWIDLPRNPRLESPPFNIVPTGWFFRSTFDVETTSYAVFGHASYSFTDQLKATLGLRFSEDEKEGFLTTQSLVDPNNGLVLIDVPSGPFGDSWTEPSGKIGLDYTPSDNHLMYISYSRGFKSGGVNATQPAAPSFEPEIVDAWEMGSKSRFLVDRLQLNTAIFNYDYQNLQLTKVVGAVLTVENAAQSTVKGVELEMNALLTERLATDFSISYVDATFDEFFSAIAPRAPVEDLSGNKLPRVPETEVNLGLEYVLDLGPGSLSLRAEYHWQDEMVFNGFDRPDQKQKAVNTYALRATYLGNDEKLRISVFGKNLGDEQYITNLTLESGLFGTPYNVSVGPPRTIGVEVGYRFR